MNSDRLLSESEARKILSVSRTYLWRLRKDGKIKAVTQGGSRVYYRASDIADYIGSLTRHGGCV